MAEVQSPRRLDAALEALRGATDATRVLAGGTDLLVELQTGRTAPDRVVDVWRVDELRGIRDEDGGLRLGALTTCTELLRDPRVGARADILGAAAAEVGGLQIQNRATLGGNLGTASPAADLNPVLLVLDAIVRLVSAADGARDVPVAAFLTGYRETARRPDELIESVWLPPRSPGERRAFRKVGTRAAQSIAKIVVALAVEVTADVDDAKIVTVHAAAGSIADRTVSLPTFASGLLGRVPDPDVVRAACRAAANADASPIDDVRSTATYRRTVLARILETMLLDAIGTPRA